MADNGIVFDINADIRNILFGDKMLSRSTVIKKVSVVAMTVCTQNNKKLCEFSNFTLSISLYTINGVSK